MKIRLIVVIAVVVFIYVAAIVTCVNYVWALSNRNDTNQTFWAERKYSEKARHVLVLSESSKKHDLGLAARFPYVVAVTRNATNLWGFGCFASLILSKWIVTSAHCR